ncbi:DNA-binding CsgD family transcriptional regulator [Mycoplana sp. BE70]|uniref:helix-turn-helix transcriptional regulator n=1 Tax=Mycoplana sp. BE70 TaxID=2817775 RepID=UPI0028581251|nr:LuxR family transcriptional regulator [Mycoplana sp. BE70]MDR6758858.1 DNA-binding CsgD family transcriptional regulator [Mycoplana sp. BE70]
MIKHPVSFGWNDRGNPLYHRVMSTVDSHSSPRPRQAKPELTAIELRCLALCAEGKPPEQIVIETDLPLSRVVEALTTAVVKLDARNITCAISRAALLNLI